MFLSMLQMKTDRRNQLNWYHLNALLCIEEEGEALGAFHPKEDDDMGFHGFD